MKVNEKDLLKSYHDKNFLGGHNAFTAILDSMKKNVKKMAEKRDKKIDDEVKR